MSNKRKECATTRPTATELLRSIGAERHKKRKLEQQQQQEQSAENKKCTSPASSSLPSAAPPQQQRDDEDYHATARFTLTRMRKKWIIYDGANGNQEVTVFCAFPKTLAEIKAMPLYAATLAGNQAEAGMWHAAAAPAGLQGGIAGLIGASQHAISGMVEAVTVKRPDALSAQQKMFRDKAKTLFKAQNDALGAYGFEASNRLQDIMQWLTSPSGKVPAHLLHGIEGCSSVTQ